MSCRQLCLVIFIFLFSVGRLRAEKVVCPSSDHVVKPASGYWRGYILRSDGHQIPFNFDIKKSGGQIIIHIDNGAEHLLVDNIQQRGDSVFINMPFFDSRFVVRITDSMHLDGYYIKNYGDRLLSIPIRAVYKAVESAGLSEKKKFPQYNISGRWSVLFRDSGDSTLAVGEFTQTGSRVKGTFLTTTGDYRFLEGTVDRDTPPIIHL